MTHTASNPTFIAAVEQLRWKVPKYLEQETIKKTEKLVLTHICVTHMQLLEGFK